MKAHPSSNVSYTETKKRVTPISKILSVLPTYLMVELANKVCSDFFGSLYIFQKCTDNKKVGNTVLKKILN